jgi:tRNA(Ser,Leu) C12 N-acetylase TAN1
VAILGSLRVPILALFIGLVGTLPVSGQACGYIHAIFYVSDSSGKFVESAKLDFLDTRGVPILNSETEVSVQKELGTFEVHHGLCSSHNNTRLVITDGLHERFEAVVDLPLNKATAPHTFSIRLARKGTKEIASIESWARLMVEVEDSEGGPVAGAAVSLTGPDNTVLFRRTPVHGASYFVVRPGIYSLLVTNGTGSHIARRNGVSLKPGPEMNVVSISPATSTKQRK